MANEMKDWTASKIPQRTDGLAVITGSTEGIGFQDALTLTSVGWQVIILGRNAQKGADALARIQERNPNARVGFEKMDLADLSSIQSFTAKMNAAAYSFNL